MLVWRSWRRPSPKAFQPVLFHRYASGGTIRIADLLETKLDDNKSDAVSVSGFLRSVRKQRQIAFASVGDGSTLQPLQVVLTPEQAKPLTNGAAVTIQGKWSPSPGGKKQAYELVANNVELLGENDASAYPIQKKFHTAEFLRTLPHLRVRTPRNALLLRLRSQVIADVTDFFSARDFIQSHPPLITSSDCEGAGEVFAVDAKPNGHANVQAEGENGAAGHESEPFFGLPKYLTVSSQLHLEALAQSVGKVWTLSPTFRAEQSDTSRHLSEFYMLEAEMAFTSDLNDIMDTVEDLLRHIVSRLKDSRIGRELLQGEGHNFERPKDENSEFQEDLLRTWDKILEPSWPRVTYQQVREVLQNAEAIGQVEFDVPLAHAGPGLQAEHEKYITENLFAGPVFVTDYPKSIKPFYMASSTKTSEEAEEDGNEPTASCFDLLVPDVLEIVGGSMREHEFDSLERAMQEQGVSNLDWYLDLRRYGSVPHGGFGLGFDRLIAHLAGVRSIRDVVAFPRYYKRCLC